LFFFNSIFASVTGVSVRYIKLIEANKSLTILSRLTISKDVKHCFVLRTIYKLHTYDYNKMIALNTKLLCEYIYTVHLSHLPWMYM